MCNETIAVYICSSRTTNAFPIYIPFFNVYDMLKVSEHDPHSTISKGVIPAWPKQPRSLRPTVHGFQTGGSVIAKYRSVLVSG